MIAHSLDNLRLNNGALRICACVIHSSLYHTIMMAQKGCDH